MALGYLTQGDSIPHRLSHAVTGAILRLQFLFSLSLGSLAVEDPGPILSESEMSFIDSYHYQFSKNGIPRAVL